MMHFYDEKMTSVSVVVPIAATMTVSKSLLASNLPPCIILIATLIFLPQQSYGFATRKIVSTKLDVSLVRLQAASRRDLLFGAVSATGLVALPGIARSNEDLTSQLFNEDGSLKNEDTVTEAKSRTVKSQWSVSETLKQSVDGQTSADGGSGENSISWQYSVPEKWSDGKGDVLYMDRTEGVNQKGCEKIVVYQLGPDVKSNLLDKATTIGVPKALGLPSVLGEGIEKADLIAGRTRYADDQKYFEFDLGKAPATCDSSSENLGLGFCPFDSLFLVCATILDSKIYVMVVQSGKEEWKRGSSDLKRVRSSFTVS